MNDSINTLPDMYGLFLLIVVVIIVVVGMFQLICLSQCKTAEWNMMTSKVLGNVGVAVLFGYFHHLGILAVLGLWKLHALCGQECRVARGSSRCAALTAFHNQWLHSRRHPRLNWSKRAMTYIRLRGGGKQMRAKSRVNQGARTLSLQPSAQEMEELDRVRCLLESVSPREAWKQQWPNPNHWFQQVLSSPWKPITSFQRLERNDFLSLGLQDETRDDVSLYVSDGVLRLALGLLCEQHCDSALFRVSHDTWVVPPDVVHSWALYDISHTRQSKINSWFLKHGSGTCSKLILIWSLRRSHWITFHIDIDNSKVVILDTLFATNQVPDLLMPSLRSLELVIQEHLNSSFRLNIVKGHSLVQPNGYDCGICSLMHCFNWGQEVNQIQSVLNFRCWITWVALSSQLEYLQGNWNTVSLVTTGSPASFSSDDESIEVQTDVTSTSEALAKVIQSAHTMPQRDSACTQSTMVVKKGLGQSTPQLQDTASRTARSLTESRSRKRDTFGTQRITSFFKPLSEPKLDSLMSQPIGTTILNSGDGIQQNKFSANSGGAAVSHLITSSEEREDDWNKEHDSSKSEWTIRSLNVGPQGLARSLTYILPLFQDRPAAVLLQDVKLTGNAEEKVRKRIRSELPEYLLYVNPVKRSYEVTSRKGNKKCNRDISSARTAILLHRGWAYRASPYDARNLSKVSDKIQMLENIMVMHHTDPFTGLKGLWINVYNDTSNHPELQQKTLDCVQVLLADLVKDNQLVVVAGDWNASLDVRFQSYSLKTNQGIRQESVGWSSSRADETFQAWAAQTGIAVISSRIPTFHRQGQELYSATLDYIFSVPKSLPEAKWSSTIRNSPDPRHDHRVLEVIVSQANLSMLPTLHQLTAPIRIRRRDWSALASGWNEALTPALNDLWQQVQSGTDPLRVLQAEVEIFQCVAKEILGTTGGKSRVMQGGWLKPDPEEKKLRRKLRRYRTALNHVNTLSVIGGKLPDLLYRIRDEGCLPQSRCPRGFWSGILPLQHSEWMRSWKSVLQKELAKTQEQFEVLERTKIRDSIDRAKLGAIERMRTPGSKEIKRWLGKLSAPVTALYMKTDYPDTVTVEVDSMDPSFATWCDREAITVSVESDSQSHQYRFSHIRPSNVWQVISQFMHHKIMLSCSDQERLVREDSDKLIAWEFYMAKEAQASKLRCTVCQCCSLIPITQIVAQSRNIVPWCTTCNMFSTGITLESDYLTSFLDSCVSNKIPQTLPLEEKLTGEISWEDFCRVVKRLPKRKAPGPDEITAEMLQRAPESALRILHVAINMILTSNPILPDLFKNGDVFLLFKKGDYDMPQNYRPIVLLSIIYKILTAIITSRLNKIAEKYHLLDDSQEGFRQLRSTHRQIQALLWERQDAEEFGRILYLVYIDFRNAFNSMDHAATWAWLKHVNLPDVELLMNIYKGTYCQVVTPYGKTAPIYLTRGTKQGDCLSPLLFSLLFNALLTHLGHLNRQEQIGYLNSLGKRKLQQAFADDLGLLTESAKGMISALHGIDRFCQWSGMQVNATKTEASGHDFKNQCSLDTSSFSLAGKSLVQLRSTEPYKYLGVRFSLSGSFAAEKQYIRSATKFLASRCVNHPYLPEQAVQVISMLQESWFRYSASVCPWTVSELDDLYKIWVGNVKAAWKISRSTASAAFVFPEEQGGKTLRQPHVIHIQALTMIIQQLIQCNDGLQERLRYAWRQLTIEFGSSKESELGEALQFLPLRQCPIARILAMTSLYGIKVILPEWITENQEAVISWYSIGKQLVTLFQAIDHNLSNDLQPTDEERKFVQNWIKKTLPCRRCGFSNILSLRQCKGVFLPPAGTLSCQDFDILTNLFKRVPLSSDISSQDLLECQPISVWTEVAQPTDYLSPGWLVVEQAIEWAITSIDTVKEELPSSVLSQAIREIADHILPSKLLRRADQEEEDYYNCTGCTDGDFDRSATKKLFLVARAQHQNLLKSKHREVYVDSIYRTILKGFKNYLPRNVTASRINTRQRREFKTQWKYMFSLPWNNPVASLGWYSDRDEVDATWELRIEHRQWDKRAALHWHELVAILERDTVNQRRRRRIWIQEHSRSTRVPAYEFPWNREQLRRDVKVIKETDCPVTDVKGSYRCVSTRGIATVYYDNADPPINIIAGNQARVRVLFQQESNNFIGWHSWRQCIRVYENRNIVLSHQLLIQLGRILSVRAVIGLHPIVVPNRFELALEKLPFQGTLAVGLDGFSSVLIILPPKDVASEFMIKSWCQAFPQVTWWIMTPQRERGKKSWFSQTGNLICSFPKRSYILQQQSAWHTCSLRNRMADCTWELWSSHNPADILTIATQLKGIRCSKTGELDTLWLVENDFLMGPGCQWYALDGNTEVLATDGSLQTDGRMGAAVTSYNSSIEDRLVGVGGNPSSTLAELVALQLASEQILRIQPPKVVILTDSLTSLNLLENRQWGIFQVPEDQVELTPLVSKVVQLLNNCCNKGTDISLVKIKAHVLDPLNEKADQLANEASNLPPSVWSGETTICKFVVDDKDPQAWSSSISCALVQLVAKRQLVKLLTVTPVPDNYRHLAAPLKKTEEWMLWKNASRHILGKALRHLPRSKKLKVLTQAHTNSFPTQVNLKRWKIAQSADCPLGCHQGEETFAHLQCYCAKLKAQRISVHHKMWTAISDSIVQHMHKDITFVPEATVSRVVQAIAAAPQPQHVKTELTQSLLFLREEGMAESNISTQSEISEGVAAMQTIQGCAVLPHKGDPLNVNVTLAVPAADTTGRSERKKRDVQEDEANSQPRYAKSRQGTSSSSQTESRKVDNLSLTAELSNSELKVISLQDSSVNPCTKDPVAKRAACSDTEVTGPSLHKQRTTMKAETASQSISAQDTLAQNSCLSRDDVSTAATIAAIAQGQEVVSYEGNSLKQRALDSVGSDTEAGSQMNSNSSIIVPQTAEKSRKRSTPLNLETDMSQPSLKKGMMRQIMPLEVLGMSTQQQQQQLQQPSKISNQVQHIDNSSRRQPLGKGRPFFPSLTRSSLSRYVRIMSRLDMPSSPSDRSGALPLATPDVAKQRPDGVLIDWKHRQFHILEFTRPYDSRRKSLALTNIYKLLKYQPLQSKLRRLLPPAWTTSIAALSVGVRGSVDEPAWTAALDILRIPRRHHESIIRTAIEASFDALLDMVEARRAGMTAGKLVAAGDSRPPP